MFKRLKNIEDKNEKQSKLLNNANKTSSYIKNESDYNYDNNKFAFYKFYRDFQNFKDRSLESKYNDISKFYSALNEFKNHETNTDETQQRKNRVINNVVALYNNYFDSYKKTFNETRNKTFGKTTLDEIKTFDPYQFKIASLLGEWLELRNDFNEAKRLIDDIRIDMNKVKVSKEDKKVLNDLSRLISDISKNKIKREDAVEGLKKSISNLDQLRKKQKTNFQNKMMQVVYQLFNSFGFNKEFIPLFSEPVPDAQEIDTTNMSDLESEESAAKRRKLYAEQPTQLKQINLNEIIKPLWFKLFRSDFLSLVKDVVNNLDNKGYQTAISNNRYDLKNAEQFLPEIVTKKISENEARKLYKNLIEPKVIELTRAKGSRGKNKRLNILNIYNEYF